MQVSSRAKTISRKVKTSPTKAAVIFASCWFCLSIILPTNGDNGKGEKHFLLVQNSPETEGTVTVTFNQRALRMVWPTRHLVLVSKAPKWQTVIFNLTSKRQYLPTPAQLLESGLRSSDEVPRLLPPIRTEKKVDHKVNVIAIDASAGRAEINDDDLEQFFQTKSTRPRPQYVISYHYIVWNQDVSATISNIMQCIYRVPLDAHVPLYLRRTLDDGKRCYALTTSQVEEKPGPVDTSVPSGYQILHDPGPVIMGDQTDEMTRMGRQWYDTDSGSTQQQQQQQQHGPKTPNPTSVHAH